jgi:YHS domain-containing protein
VTDPEFGLFHLQRALWDPVDPELLGSLEPELHATVNGEIYRFGSRETLRRFRSAPALYCGLLRDPVNGVRFNPSTKSPRDEWNGGPYIFSSDSTRAEFHRGPKRHEVRRDL